MTLGRDVRTVNLGLQKHFENIPQCPDEICCKMPGKRGLVLDFRWEQWDQSGWFDFLKADVLKDVKSRLVKLTRKV